MGNSITINFKVNEERDADVIAWLEARPNRSAAIRDAIRAAILGEVTTAQLMRKLESIDNKLARGVTLNGNGATDDDEESEQDAEALRLAQAGLDELLG